MRGRWKSWCANLARSVPGRREALAEPFRYVQFAQWQEDLLQSEEDDAKQARTFWDARLPVVALPAAASRERLRMLRFSRSRSQYRWRRSLRAAILAGREDAKQVLLSALECLLHRLSGQTAFSVGFFADNREYEELENAIGGLGRTLPLRARVENDFSFADVLRKVVSEQREATAVQEYFVPEAIGLEGDLVASATRNLQAGFRRVFELERVSVVSERYKLRLNAVRRGAGIELEFQYDASRLERASVERIAGYYQNLLTAAVANPETAVSKLPLLSENERKQLLVEWNATAAEFPGCEVFA